MTNFHIMNDPDDKISEKETRLRERFRRVFRGEDGRFVRDYIVKNICGWDVAMFFTDARKQDFWQGQRAVAKRLLQLTTDNE